MNGNTIFSPNEIKIRKRLSNKRWHDSHLEHLRIYGRKRYAQKRDHIVATVRAYRSRRRDYYRQMNRQWRAKNRIRRRAINNAWAARNRHKTRASSARAKFLRRSVIECSAFTDKNVTSLISKWKSEPYFYCHYCANPFPTDQLHVDHKIPISRGGMHECSNLCRSCPKCNLGKQKKTPSEFFQYRRSLCR